MNILLNTNCILYLPTFKFSADCFVSCSPNLEKWRKDNGAKENLELKKKYTEFLVSQGIRDDIKIFVTGNHGSGTAFGTSNSRDAWVVIDDKVYENNRDSVGPILKHEFSHIKNNDIYNSSRIGLIASFACAILLPLYVSKTLAIVLTYTIACIASSIFSYCCESKADLFGITHSTDKELQGFMLYFESDQNYYIEARKSNFIYKLFFNSKGDERFNIFYPTMSRRIQNINNELLRRKSVNRAAL